MNSIEPVRWGIVGPGVIAKRFTAALPHSETGRLAAIATRNPHRRELAADFPGARILAGYDAMLADPDIDAVYIATPHPGHAEWAIRAAEAGKHVLCEKPMSVSFHEAEAMIHAARKAGTFLGEAFMNRLHPQTERIVGLIKAGTIGDVRMIKASFGVAVANPDPDHRLFALDTAGGAILDICCYPVSAARLIAGAASGRPFLDPDTVRGVGRLGATGVDEWASAVLRFPNDIIAEVSGSIALAQDNTVRVYGTNGWFDIRSPWFCTGREGGVAEIVIHRGDGDETLTIHESGWLYAFEIDAVGRAIRAGRSEFEPPGMTWADTLGNMAVLDAWRSDVGLVYDIETSRRRPMTVSGRPLAKPAKPMTGIELPGIAKPTSSIALGSAGFANFVHGSILLDAFYERGGTVVDTAFQYGMGHTDRLVGQWMAARDVREEIVLIGKGAHTPLCYPDVIARQLTRSLEWLQTDYLDVYLMHRDNPDIPVGEFVDAMDAEVQAGRVRIYGGSNWSRARLDAAFAYAKANDRTRPGALSNNFSLAEMVDEVWPGVAGASDDAWKAWLRRRKIPLFAWSSQARGFFTDRAGRDKHDDPELSRCWYSEANFARRDRAMALAERLGKSPLHVALAYCMKQDFPVVPLIGPLTLQELEDSLEALEIDLTPQDVRWLEQGERRT